MNRTPINPGIPNPSRPMRLPGGGGFGPAALVPGQGGPGVGKPSLLPGFARTPTGVYMPIQRQEFSLAIGESAELLLEPPFLRVYLMLRNVSGSGGVLGVGFNSTPSSPAQCDFEFAAGDGFVWDQFVPQNRIFVYAFNGPLNGILNYSNWEPTA